MEFRRGMRELFETGGRLAQCIHQWYPSVAASGKDGGVGDPALYDGESSRNGVGVDLQPFPGPVDGASSQPGGLVIVSQPTLGFRRDPQRFAQRFEKRLALPGRCAHVMTIMCHGLFVSTGRIGRQAAGRGPIAELQIEPAADECQTGAGDRQLVRRCVLPGLHAHPFDDAEHRPDGLASPSGRAGVMETLLERCERKDGSHVDDGRFRLLIDRPMIVSFVLPLGDPLRSGGTGEGQADEQ